MPSARVHQVTPSLESAIAKWYAGADLVDSYAVALPKGSPTDARVLARLALGAQPRWFKLLMGARDMIVAPLGVKTSSKCAARAAELKTGSTSSRFYTRRNRKSS